MEHVLERNGSCIIQNMTKLYLINESMSKTNETLCAVWYHFYNLKNMEKHPWRCVTFSKSLAKSCFELKLWFYNNSKYKFYYEFLIKESSVHTYIAAV